MHLEVLNPNLFLLYFFHELDMQRIMKGGSWTFNKASSHHKEAGGRNESNHFTAFSGRLLCIRIHDLPTCGFVAERIVKAIGNFIGGLHVSKFQKL